ncbi:MAG TPA: hypothetical protein PKC43_01820 [Phycisphaerales bacterium]|nr:hypothetical protein [Phycisphaerales bacterium]HMP36163.1 hypothetical protein [Phycisphaerales bacterium]
MAPTLPFVQTCSGPPFSRGIQRSCAVRRPRGWAPRWIGALAATALAAALVGCEAPSASYEVPIGHPGHPDAPAGSSPLRRDGVAGSAAALRDLERERPVAAAAGPQRGLKPAPSAPALGEQRA